MIPAIFFVVLALILVGAAARSRRVDTGRLWRGIGLALAAALVILVLCTLLIGFGMAGKTFIFDTLDLARALTLGFLVGLGIGSFVVLFGSIFVAGGLLLGRGELWANTAWFVGPLLAAALWIAFPNQVGALISLGAGSASDVEFNAGDMTLTVTRTGEAARTWPLAGTCEHIPDERVTTIDARDPMGEGGPVFHLRLADDGTVLELGILLREGAFSNVALGSGQPSGGQAQVVAGWSPMSGSVTFSGAAPFDPPATEPDTSQSWSGTLTWQCDRPL